MRLLVVRVLRRGRARSGCLGSLRLALGVPHHGRAHLRHGVVWILVQRLRVRLLGLPQMLGHEVRVAEVEQDGHVAGILRTPGLEERDRVARVAVAVVVGLGLVLVRGERVTGRQGAGRRVSLAPAVSPPPELMPAMTTAAATATATPTAMKARIRLTRVLPLGERLGRFSRIASGPVARDRDLPANRHYPARDGRSLQTLTGG